MAGTMMKTRRRVKSTVREMPSRLTIRLSKGSNRNIVDNPGKANALVPKSKTAFRRSPQMAPAWERKRVPKG